MISLILLLQMTRMMREVRSKKWIKCIHFSSIVSVSVDVLILCPQ